MNAHTLTRDVGEIVADVKSGKGPAGTILRDTAMASSLKSSVDQLQDIAKSASILAKDLDSVVTRIGRKVEDGPGPVNLVLNDTAVSGNIRRTLANVEKGSASFNENMEAMKHNFFFRGYFRKQEKAKKEQNK
jgi:phospholipid/cholesterol/gamma-HCH transport system substrate-binding protein